jgi:hypothetical protein
LGSVARQHKIREALAAAAAAEEKGEHVTAAFCAQIPQECPSSTLIEATLQIADVRLHILVPPKITQVCLSSKY